MMCTGMILLSSTSITIHDLMKILCQNKEDEDLKIITDILKGQDENDDGHIDF